MERLVQTADGRTLAVEDYGDPAAGRLLDHDGHLTLLERRIGEVHDWLSLFF